jgi:hypothetical protein
VVDKISTGQGGIMAGGLGKAFSVAIAAQFQALGVLALAWLSGEWLNENYPKGFNWYLVTFLVAVVVIGQTFYVMLRHFMKSDSSLENPDNKGSESPVKSRGRGGN